MKMIGVYDSRQSAVEAVNRMSGLPGFSDSVDGFRIDARRLGEFGWADGFDEKNLIQDAKAAMVDEAHEVQGITYLVQHEYEYPEEVDHVRFIGVFSSESKAVDLVDFLRKKPGFISHPDGFFIDPYEIGKDHWQDGFVTATGFE